MVQHRKLWRNSEIGEDAGVQIPLSLNEMAMERIWFHIPSEKPFRAHRAKSLFLGEDADTG